jgi:hypothetical protein
VEEVAREEIDKCLDVVNIYAAGNTSTQTINEFEIMIRLRAGSRLFR